MNIETKKYLHISSKPKYFIFLCIYYFLYPICHILYGRKKNWIICERGDDAQDNGYIFFKYLTENRPETHATYLIKKSSPDYKKVASLGKIVEFGSLKHFLMMIGVPTKASAQLFGYSPWVQSTLYYRRHKTRHKHIFLQHGVTKNDIPGFYNDVCKSIKLFVCGAEPEYEYINNNFGYSNGVVKYTGFPRFDNLNDANINEHILFMPTWRRYLSGLSESEFLDSQFYKEWNSLLNDSDLMHYCRDRKIHIDFYLHHELQRHSHLFKNTDIVNVINFGSMPVQKLLKDSAVLITDFSSVFFDFAYMKKPMVFFQFDEIEYNKGHYAKGYFDYRRDGFGPVVLDVNGVTDEIISIVSRGYRIDEKYLFNINRFFPLRDKNNCNRVYKAILDIKS